MEEVERRIGELRATVRRSVLAGDRARANALRAELRRAERAWDEAVTALADSTAGAGRETAAGSTAPDDTVESAVPRPRSSGRRGAAMLPVREQVHHALTLLSVPAAPKLLVEVHTAFLGSEEIAHGRLTHLRRDEERSFRAAPYSRPYYLCATLTLDYLTPVRGLLAVSTWPLERRIIGPLSPRVDFLTAAIRVAEEAARLAGRPSRLSPPVARLLRRFALNIPGMAGARDAPDPEAVAAAARRELAVHEAADRTYREVGAVRAGTLLDDAEQLFGRRQPRPD